jgi:hypothetical protein
VHTSNTTQYFPATTRSVRVLRGARRVFGRFCSAIVSGLAAYGQAYCGYPLDMTPTGLCDADLDGLLKSFPQTRGEGRLEKRTPPGCDRPGRAGVAEP